MTVVWAWCRQCGREVAGLECSAAGWFVCPLHQIHQVIAHVEVPYSEGGKK